MGSPRWRNPRPPGVPGPPKLFGLGPCLSAGEAIFCRGGHPRQNPILCPDSRKMYYCASLDDDKLKSCRDAMDRARPLLHPCCGGPQNPNFPPIDCSTLSMKCPSASDWIPACPKGMPWSIDPEDLAFVPGSGPRTGTEQGAIRPELSVSGQSPGPQRTAPRPNLQSVYVPPTSPCSWPPLKCPNGSAACTTEGWVCPTPQAPVANPILSGSPGRTLPDLPDFSSPRISVGQSRGTSLMRHGPIGGVFGLPEGFIPYTGGPPPAWWSNTPPQERRL